MGEIFIQRHFIGIMGYPVKGSDHYISNRAGSFARGVINHLICAQRFIILDNGHIARGDHRVILLINGDAICLKINRAIILCL